LVAQINFEKKFQAFCHLRISSKQTQMQLLAKILVSLVAFEHLYILWLEMFAWETRGRKVFRGALRQDMFGPTKVLAANQGLYNGFLAAGLAWSVLIADGAWSRNVAVFFLGCVIVAGLYGGTTAGRKIIYVQALPAAVALVSVLFL
jgi:putative membrane protein